MRAVVTGGAGFIGSKLAAELMSRGHDVVIIDDFSTGSTDVAKRLEGLGASVIRGRSKKIADLTPVDVVFHLGMPSSSPMYRENPHLLDLLIEDAVEILNYCKETGARLVYASTSSIYNGNEPPYREDMPVLPTDLYTEGRYWLERLSKVYHDLYGVESVGLRLFSIYGPNERPKGRFANVISQMIWAALEGKEFVIYGDGSQTRDFVYVDDAVRAFILAAESDIDWSIYNVGSGVETSFNEVVKLIRGMGLRLRVKYVENPIKNYVQRTLADTTKAEEELGFKVSIGLEEGVRACIESYSQGTIMPS